MVVRNIICIATRSISLIGLSLLVGLLASIGEAASRGQTMQSAAAWAGHSAARFVPGGFAYDYPGFDLNRRGLNSAQSHWHFYFFNPQASAHNLEFIGRNIANWDAGFEAVLPEFIPEPDPFAVCYDIDTSTFSGVVELWSLRLGALVTIAGKNVGITRFGAWFFALALLGGGVCLTYRRFTRPDTQLRSRFPRWLVPTAICVASLPFIVNTIYMFASTFAREHMRIAPYQLLGTRFPLGVFTVQLQWIGAVLLSALVMYMTASRASKHSRTRSTTPSPDATRTTVAQPRSMPRIHPGRVLVGVGVGIACILIAAPLTAGWFNRLAQPLVGEFQPILPY